MFLGTKTWFQFLIPIWLFTVDFLWNIILGLCAVLQPCILKKYIMCLSYSCTILQCNSFFISCWRPIHRCSETSNYEMSFWSIWACSFSTGECIYPYVLPQWWGKWKYWPCLRNFLQKSYIAAVIIRWMIQIEK